MNQIEQLKEQIYTLKERLLTGNPDMPVLLQTIHKKLREDAELVTTLSEEEVGVIVAGLKRHQNVEISVVVSKAKGKSAKNLTLDDL